MNYLTRVYFNLLMFLFTVLAGNEIWAGNISTWGNNVVDEGRNFGVSLVSGGFVITGVLFAMGVGFAGQLLSKIMIGGALIFGGATLAAVLKNIFN